MIIPIKEKLILNEAVNKANIKPKHFSHAHYIESWVEETLGELRRNEISPSKAVKDLESRIEQLYEGIRYNEDLIPWVESKVQEVKSKYDISEKEGEYVLGSRGSKTLYVTGTALNQHNPMVYQDYDINKARVYSYDKALETATHINKYVTGVGPFNVIEKPLNENVSLAFDPQKDKRKLNKHNKKASIHSMRSGLAPIRKDKDGVALTSDGKVNQGVLKAPKQTHCGQTNAGCANPGGNNCNAGGGPASGGTN